MRGKVVSISVSGLQELDARLGLLSKATARNVLRRVLTKAGQPMADRMAELAPDDPNTGAPDLHTSMLVSPRLKNEVGKAEYSEVLRNFGTKAEAVQAMRDARRAAGGGSFAQMYVGPNSSIYYAHFLEFGTARQAPRPFARPAYDEKKGEVVDIIKAELGDAIDKAVARMMKRAAKKAAGG